MPKIVSVLVGDDPASILYTKLKKAAAERVGILFEIYHYTNEPLDHLSNKIQEIGASGDVTGVMVQLPIPGLHGHALQEVLATIPRDKDVDGLRWEESGVMPATVRAVLSIVDKIIESQIINSQILKSGNYVVLGARGAVGRPLVHFLRKRGLEVAEVEWDTPEPTRIILAGEVVISCVGKAGIVIGEMVKEGVVAIDVGMSEKKISNHKFSNSQINTVVGDMTQEVYQKASVAVPVPGGVGPVTVASLMANAAEITKKV